jgi:hypothetical protein
MQMEIDNRQQHQYHPPYHQQQQPSWTTSASSMPPQAIMGMDARLAEAVCTQHLVSAISVQAVAAKTQELEFAALVDATEKVAREYSDILHTMACENETLARLHMLLMATKEANEAAGNESLVQLLLPLIADMQPVDAAGTRAAWQKAREDANGYSLIAQNMRKRSQAVVCPTFDNRLEGGIDALVEQVSRTERYRVRCELMRIQLSRITQINAKAEQCKEVEQLRNRISRFRRLFASMGIPEDWNEGAEGVGKHAEAIYPHTQTCAVTRK